MLLRIIGWLLMVLGGFMTIPLLATLLYKDSATQPILLSMAITIASAVCLMSLKPRSKDLGKREAILLTALTWIILSLFGMLPFLLSGTHASVTDAFFETISGFTTTGASVLGTLEHIPHSILLWRCLLQWIGGLGIILFTLAVVPMLNNRGGMLMFNEEVTGITHDKLRPRISNTAKALWYIYIIFTIACILLLWFSKMSLFEAICHGLSTMSTGGFSTSDMSVRDWNSPYIILILTMFMFIGGINFNLIFATVYGGRHKMPWHNDAFRWFCYGILAAYITFAVAMWVEGVAESWEDFTLIPLFQSVSTLTSTGLLEPHFETWGPIAYVVLIIFMAIGGCAGSTSGGVKIDRIIILFRFLKNEMYRTMYPSVVRAVSYNGHGMPYMIVMKVLAFISLYFLVILTGGILLSAMGVPVSQSFFFSLSAISNSGIGLNMAGTSEGIALLPDAGKWVLGVTMLTGRLELYTVLLLFSRAFWKK